MRAGLAKPLRWFVGITLLFGGVALAAGSVILQDTAMLPSWFLALVAVWILALAALTFLAVRMTWPWPVPAALLVVSLMAGVIWARFDSMGHDALSGLAPFVALVTGVGILMRQRWAWPVAFASVTGFGPIILLFAPLPEAAIYAAFGLFVVDAVLLLALTEEFFSKPGS